MKRFAVFAALLVCLLPTLAAAECGSEIVNTVTNGTHQFGLRADGFRLGKGQSFTLPCDAEMVSVEFRFILPTEPYNGIAPLAEGDTLIVTIMQEDFTPVASAIHVVQADENDQFMAFDFTGAGYGIAGGDYIAGCTTPQDRAAFFRKAADVAPGFLYTAVDGVWSGVADSDAVFRIVWDAAGPFTAAEELRWGDLKARFR